jgi:hypothetical protein
MKEAKPIALIKVKTPRSKEESDYYNDNVIFYLEKKLPDYRVLVIGCLDEHDFQLEVFNGDNITEVQFNELKELIKE